MKTVEYTSYGSPEVMQIKEVPMPQPGANEILVRIHATTVTATEAKFRRGDPYFTRLFTGLSRPRLTRLGEELAGEVAAVGDAVTKFKLGDKVFGTAGPNFGANAEYICLPEEAVITHMPTNLSYNEVASSIDGFLTALPFLRDHGKIGRGQQVFIVGASGSVGASAVQIAKYYGAKVTAVCSAGKVDVVRRLGVDHVIDYCKQDFTTSEDKYDIIFDAVGKTNFGACKDLLAPSGRFLEVDMSLSMIGDLLLTSLSGKKKILFAATGLRKPSERLQDLYLLEELLEAKIIKPTLDRSFPLGDIVEAHRYVDQGHKMGNVAITVCPEKDTGELDLISLNSTQTADYA